MADRTVLFLESGALKGVSSTADNVLCQSVGSGLATDFLIKRAGTTGVTVGSAAVTVASGLDMASAGLGSLTGWVNATLSGDLAVNGGDITTTQTTFNLLNTTATTINFGGAASTAVNIGVTGGLADIKGNAIVRGDLTVIGTTTTTHEESLQVGDEYIDMNFGDTTVAAATGGMVVNYLPTATTTTVATGGFTAGVPAGAQPQVITTGSATFTAGDIIMISGAANAGNNGFCEVDSHVGTTLKIKGIGTTGTVEDFSHNQFTTDATVQGTITKVNVSVMRSGTDGVWETGKGATVPITYSDLSTAAAAGWTDAGTNVHLTTSTDSVTVGPNSEIGKFGIIGDTDEIQLRVRGNATQTSNLVQFETSVPGTVWSLTNGGATNQVGGLSVGSVEVIASDRDYAVNLLPSANTLDIGVTGQRWRYGWFSNDVTTAGNFVSGGTLTVNGTTNTISGSASITLQPGTGYGVIYAIQDNVAAAWKVAQGADTYINVDTTNGTEAITLGNGTTDPDILIPSDGPITQSGTGQVSFAGNVDATNGLDVTTANLTVGGANFTVAPGTGNITTAGDLAVNGGDMTSTATTFNLLDATVTTLSMAGAATAVDIGASTGTTTINNNATVTLDLAVNGGDMTSSAATFNLLNSTVTTLSLGGAATALSMGAATGTLTIGNPTITGTNCTALNLNGASPVIATTSTTASVFDSTVTTLNLGGAATAWDIGASTGTGTLNNANIVVTGDLAVNGGDLTTSATTFNLVNGTATTVNLGGGATTAVNIGNAAGNVAIAGNESVAGTLNVNGATLATDDATFALLNTTATTINFGGGATTAVNIGNASGSVVIAGTGTVAGTLNANGGAIVTDDSTFALVNTTATTVNFAGAATTVEIGAATGTTSVNNALTVDLGISIAANYGLKLNEGTAPAAAANAGFVYSKDVAGITELFYRADSGGGGSTEIQLTNNGIVNAATGWVDDGAIVRLTTATDAVGIGTASEIAKLGVVGNDTTQVTAIVRAVGSQTANLLELQNSTPTTQFSVTVGGATDQLGSFSIGATPVWEADRDLAINLVPNADNSLTAGTAARRLASVNAVALNSYNAASDANPIAQLTTTGLNLGAGGATALDVNLSRGATNRLDLATGDSLNLVNGSLQFGATTMIEADRDIAVNLMPNGNGTLDIGQTGTRWKDGWFSGNVSATGNLISGATITVNGTTNTISGTAGLTIDPTTTLTLELTDSSATALTIAQSTNNYLVVDTNSEVMTFGNATTNPNFTFSGTGALTLPAKVTVTAIGEVFAAPAGSGVTQHYVVYKTTNADEVDHANAGAIATANTIIGVCRDGISAAGTGVINNVGVVTLYSADAISVGDMIYLSTTAGQVTKTAPTTSGQVVAVVGYAKTSKAGGGGTFTAYWAPRTPVVNP